MIMDTIVMDTIVMDTIVMDAIIMDAIVMDTKLNLCGLETRYIQSLSRNVTIYATKLWRLCYIKTPGKLVNKHKARGSGSKPILHFVQ